MSCIRLNAITIDTGDFLGGTGGSLLIENGYIQLTDTTSSDNIFTGAIVVGGGISIAGTSDATSATSGGAATLAGGFGVSGQTFLGSHLTLESATSTLAIQSNLVYPRLFVDSVNNKNFYVSVDGINQQIAVNGSLIALNSPEIYTGTGIVVIGCTQNATSSTAGGALTIVGGLSVELDTYIGGSVIVEENVHVQGGIFSDLILSNSSSGAFTLSSGSVYIDTNAFDVTGLFSLNSSVSSLTSSELLVNGALEVTGNVVVQNGMSVQNGLAVSSGCSVQGSLALTSNYTASNTQLYQDTLGNFVINPSQNVNILGNTLVLGASSFVSNTNGILNISTVNGCALNSNTSNLLTFYPNNTLNASVNFTVSTQGTFVINSQTNGIILENTLGSLTLLSSGSVSISQNLSLVSGGIFLPGNVVVTSGSGIVIAGSGGILVSSGNLSAGGTNPFSLTNPSGIFNMIGASTSSSLSLVGSQSVFEITNNNNGLNGGYTLGVISGGSQSLLIGSLVFCSTSGTVSINSTSPNAGFAFNVNGSISISGGAAFLQGVSCASLSTLSVSTANLNVNSVASLNTVSQNTTTSSLIVQNASVFGGQMSSSYVGTSPSLLVAGDVTFQKDFFVTGELTCNSSGTFASLSISNTTLTNTLAVNSTVNSTNTLNGSLTVAGGASVSKDFYIGGTPFIYNGTNLTIPSTTLGNILSITDTFNILRVTLDYSSPAPSVSPSIIGPGLTISRYNTSNQFIESVLCLEYTTGNTIFLNTTASYSASQASVVLSGGGLSVNCTMNSTSVYQGGALTVAGGASFGRDIFVGGNLITESTTASVSTVTGSGTFAGGVGVSGNLNVGGNVVVTGDLTVNGGITNIDTTNTVISDNILVLNSGASGSHDAGVLIQRYQTDNNSSGGDIISDTPALTDTLPSQSALTSPSNQIVFSGATSSTNNFYNNYWILVQTGFSAGQVRQITGYVGSTHTATLDAPFTTQNPAAGDTVEFFNKSFVGFVYNETTGVIDFGSTASDPGLVNVVFSGYLGLNCATLTTTSTELSTSSSVGAVVTNSLAVSSSQNATSSTAGGAVTVGGGLAVGQNLFVGTNLTVADVNLTPNQGDIFASTLFTALTNQSDVVFLTLSSPLVNGYDIYLVAQVTFTDPSDNLYANFHLIGVNKFTEWENVTTYVGDDTGISFEIAIDPSTSNGLIEYTTPDYPSGLVGITFIYRVFTN